MRYLSPILLFVFLFLAPFVAGAQVIDKRCTTPGNNACVDWTSGIAIAVGNGAPASMARSMSQKNLTARRAARLDAARNLMELVKGINLTSSSTTKSAMLESDEVTTAIKGRLYSLKQVGKEKYFSDGSVQVRVEASLRAIIPQQLFLEGGETPQAVGAPTGSFSGSSLDTGFNYSGLIIDARGTGVMPAMSPKIIDPDGKEVYGSAFVSREWAIKQGVVGYVKSMDQAKANDRVKGTPAVVKATESKGRNKADLVISANDANALREMAQKQKFLQESRVLIILD